MTLNGEKSAGWQAITSTTKSFYKNNFENKIGRNGIDFRVGDKVHIKLPLPHVILFFITFFVLNVMFFLLLAQKSIQLKATSKSDDALCDSIQKLMAIGNELPLEVEHDSIGETEPKPGTGLGEYLDPTVGKFRPKIPSGSYRVRCVPVLSLNWYLGGISNWYHGDATKSDDHRLYRQGGYLTYNRLFPTSGPEVSRSKGDAAIVSVTHNAAERSTSLSISIQSKQSGNDMMGPNKSNRLYLHWAGSTNGFVFGTGRGLFKLQVPVEDFQHNEEKNADEFGPFKPFDIGAGAYLTCTAGGKISYTVNPIDASEFFFEPL